MEFEEEDSSEKPSWFKRVRENIVTKTKDKKSTPDGLWEKCPRCKVIVPSKDLINNCYVCTQCDYHVKIGSREYFSILFDNGKFTELDADLSSGDPLEFTDTSSYVDRIRVSQSRSGLKDAVRSGTGKMNGQQVVMACMDFSFIGGSMGSVVGEKIARAIDYGREHRIPVLVISKSGGARMMEAAFSLMQMAKTSAALGRLAEAGLPFISVLTHPTMGGVTASFATLGDVILAEPGALVGFAGARVIKDTTKQTLPAGFQTAEFLLKHGLIDQIVPRLELRGRLHSLLTALHARRRLTAR